jgi:hypothetical protein
LATGCMADEIEEYVLPAPEGVNFLVITPAKGERSERIKGYIDQLDDMLKARDASSSDYIAIVMPADWTIRWLAPELPPQKETA